MDQPGRLTILAEQLRYSGGRTFRTGRTRIEEAPPGVVVVTESGRVVEVGDALDPDDDSTARNEAAVIEGEIRARGSK